MTQVTDENLSRVNQSVRGSISGGELTMYMCARHELDSNKKRKHYKTCTVRAGRKTLAMRK